MYIAKKIAQLWKRLKFRYDICINFDTKYFQTQYETVFLDLQQNLFIWSYAVIQFANGPTTYFLNS